jgi:hypothetical protein
MQAAICELNEILERCSFGGDTAVGMRQDDYPTCHRWLRRLYCAVCALCEVFAQRTLAVERAWPG